MRTFIYIFAFIAALVGCESTKDSSAVNDVMRAINGLQKSVSDLAPAAKDIQSAAGVEVDKLYAIEYKVLQIDNSVEPKAFEQQLAALGADRWECFSIVDTGSGYMVTCSRRPASYLRYVLKFLPVPLP